MKLHTKIGFWTRLRASFLLDSSRGNRNIEEMKRSGLDEILNGNGFFIEFDDFRNRNHIFRVHPAFVKITVQDGVEIYFPKDSV